MHEYIISIFVNHAMIWILLNSSDPLFSALCVLWGNNKQVLGLRINNVQQLFIYRLITPLFIYILKWIWFRNTNVTQKLVIIGIFRMRTRREWRHTFSNESIVLWILLYTFCKSILRVRYTHQIDMNTCWGGIVCLE